MKECEERSKDINKGIAKVKSGSYLVGDKDKTPVTNYPKFQDRNVDMEDYRDGE